MPEKIIHITVRDKFVSVDKDAKIVCCNTDYKAVFDFDSEWDSYDAKTAYFAVNGKLIPVVFRGVECDIPYIENTTLVGVGVGSSDISEVDAHEVVTTLPAYLPALLSIKDVGGGIEAPTIDEWNQVIGLINAGMVRGEKGEKGDKGDKGDAGAIKFIPVDTFPTEDIDYSAIYLVRLDDTTDDNRYEEYAYIKGKWEKIGETTLKIDTSEFVKKTDYPSSNGTQAGVIKISNGRNGLYVNPSNGMLTVMSATNADIDSRNAYDHAIVPTNLDYAVKVGVTTNSEKLTDDEKASACEWIGAAPRLNPNANGFDGIWVATQNGGQWRLIQVNAYTAQPWYIPAYMSEGIGDYTSGGYLLTETPTRTYHATNKTYVDNLPNHLTLTDEQQAKWREMVGALGSEEANNLFVHSASTSGIPMVYAVNRSGQTMYPLSSIDGAIEVGTIALYRNSETAGIVAPEATLVVADPRYDYQAANKKYVDQKIAEAELGGGGSGGGETETVKEVVYVDISQMIGNQAVAEFVELSQRFAGGECVIVGSLAGQIAIINSVDTTEPDNISWAVATYGKSDDGTPVFVGVIIKCVNGLTLEISREDVALDFATKDFVKSLPTELALSVDEKLQWREMIGAINQAYVDTELAKKADNLKLLEVENAIPKKVSKLENDSGYVNDLSNYYNKSQVDKLVASSQEDLNNAITAVDGKIPTKTETWTFTLENGTTVTKEIFVK